MLKNYLKIENNKTKEIIFSGDVDMFLIKNQTIDIYIDNKLIARIPVEKETWQYLTIFCI